MIHGTMTRLISGAAALAIAAAFHATPATTRATAHHQATAAADATATTAPLPANQHRATAAPEGFKLPWPDALPAVAITPGKRGGTFIYSSFGEGPKTFDPVTANEGSSVDLINIMFAGLISYDYTTQRHVPNLLKEWYMEEDPHNWILRLRSGMKWSDGQPITADDFMFTMQVIFDPNIVTPSKDTLQVAGKPIQFEKVDDLTVRARTAQPTGFMDVMMSSVALIPKHALEATYKAGKYESALNISTPPEKIVCSGPYRLKLFQPAERVVLERNPHYFRYDKNGTQLPYLDTVIFSYAPDTDQMLLRFKRGDADAVGSPKPESIANMRDGQKEGNYTLFDCGPGSYVSYLWFNLKEGSGSDGKPFVDPARHKVFINEKFRKAVLHAINKDAIITSILRGQAVSVWGDVSPALKEWHNPDVTKYEHDPDKADGDARRDRHEGRGRRRRARPARRRQVLVRVHHQPRQQEPRGGGGPDRRRPARGGHPGEAAHSWTSTRWSRSSTTRSSTRRATSPSAAASTR